MNGTNKKIYSTSTAYSLSLAFATLFLNRTNRSGILNTGPIGGYAQDGEWKLDVRFDKEVIIAKIDSIAKEKERIAVLSFRRLKEQYGQDYKGGILLIDELDATLYGFSQEKLVEYLWQAAGIYKIQIVFTTHSPIILKCVNKCQRKERQERGITFPPFAYDSAIVHLEPQYDSEGKRTIMPQNISTSTELNQILNDLNLS